MTSHHICEKVDKVPEGAAHRRWTLRTELGYHHGQVRLSESPLYLELSWRTTAGSPVHFVGIFRLDLHELLNKGYIQPNPIDNPTGEYVSINIVLNDNNQFSLQRNQNAEERLFLAKKNPK